MALTNNYTAVASNLALTDQMLKESQEKVRVEELKIAELENQNQVLDKRALDLSSELTNLTTQISATEKKLAASEGDKAFLEERTKKVNDRKDRVGTSI